MATATGSHVVVPWGKYRGRPLSEIPPDYLEWCIAQDFVRDAHGDAFSPAPEAAR